jgi:hypothetical protein
MHFQQSGEMKKIGSNEESNARCKIESGFNPLAVTFSMAKKITGLGLTTLWKLGKEQRIELVRVGRRTLITFRSLQALLTPEGNPQPRRRGRPRKQAA